MSYYSTNAAPRISQRDFSPAQPQAQTSVPGNILNVVPVDNAGHVLPQLQAVQWIPQYHPYGAQFSGSYTYYPPQQHYTTVPSTQQAPTSPSMYGAIPGVIPGGLVQVPITPPPQFVTTQSVPNAPGPAHAELPAPPTAAPLPNGAKSKGKKTKDTLLRLHDALDDPDMQDVIEWYEDEDEDQYGFRVPDIHNLDKVLRKHFNGTCDNGIKLSSFERTVKNQGFKKLSPKGATDVVWIHDSKEFRQGNRQNSDRVRVAAAAASSQHPQSTQNASMSPTQPTIVEAFVKELKSSMQESDGRMMNSMQQLEARMMNSMQQFEARMMDLVGNLVAEVKDLKSVNMDLKSVNDQLVKKIESLEITNNEPNGKTSADSSNPTQPQHAQVPSGHLTTEPDKHNTIPTDISPVRLGGSTVVKDTASGRGFYSHVTFEASSVPRPQMRTTSPRRMASGATLVSRHPAPSRPPSIESSCAVTPLDPYCAVPAARNPIQHNFTPVYSTAIHSNSSTSLGNRMSWRYDEGDNT